MQLRYAATLAGYNDINNEGTWEWIDGTTTGNSYTNIMVIKIVVEFILIVSCILSTNNSNNICLRNK